MIRPNIGFPTRLLEGTLREKIREVGRLGANGIQLDLRYELRPSEMTETGKRQLRHLLQENGLSVAPATFSLRRALIETEGLEERVAGISAAIRFASELKIHSLIIRPGVIPDPDSPEHAIFIDVLEDLVRVGDHLGVILTLTSGREEAAKLLSTLREVTTAPLAVNFDPAAAVMAGFDPASELRTLSEQIRHVRIRDGLRDSDGSGVEVPVGRGEVDWDSLLASLAECDFGGWLTPDRTSGEDPARDAARAIAFVKNVLPF